MKNKILLIVLMVAFIVILVGLNKFLEYNTQKRLEDDMENVEYNLEENIIQNGVSKEKNVEEVKGIVVEVTEENFKEEILESEKTVLIDFYATWCEPCKIMSPIIEAIAEENKDIKVVKIDVDKEENLAYEYEVYSIPTFMVIKEGKIVDFTVGITKKRVLLDMLK